MDSESNDVFKFLGEVSAKKVEVTEEISSLLRAIVESDSVSDNARLLAAQLFFRFGGEITENDVKNGFLVAGCAEECDASKLAWLMAKSDEILWSPSVIRSLIRGFLKRKEIPQLEGLKRVWIELHMIWHRPRLSESVRWCLLKLYDLLNGSGQSYEQTFRFYLVDTQRFVKQRYMAISLLIPKLSLKELENNLGILFYDLKECQNHQHLSSITAECVVAIGKRIPDNQQFLDFLLEVFLSEQRQVSFSSLRYWVAQFSSEKAFRPTLIHLLDHLRKPEVVKADEDFSNLTDIDFFWGLEEREVDPDPWDQDDRRSFAFLVVLQAAVKCFGHKMIPESDGPLLDTYLKHRRSLIRAEALKLAPESVLEEFFLDNAATDDSQLRDAMKTRMGKWNPSGEAVTRVQKWLMVDSNHQRLSFVLDLAEKKGIDLDEAALKPLTGHADSDVRRKALGILKRTEGFVEFLRNSFLSHLDDFEMLSSIISALLAADQKEFLRDHLKSLTNQVLQISVRSKLTSDLNEFLDYCGSVIEENLVLSGSERLGECSSMAELNCRMEIDKTLLISDQCTENIGSYAGILIECSKSMVDRVLRQPLEDRLRVLKQIWSILLRSRHKGVVDDCATQFERLRTTFTDEEVRGILEDTLKLFVDDKCSSRNLAFWRILLCFPNDVDRLVGIFIDCLSTKSETVILRALKALKAFLGTSKYSKDCEKFYPGILRFILGEYSRTSWAVRSAMNHTFEVLVHALFARIPSNVPLCNFMADYPEVWEVLNDAVNAVDSGMDPQIVLILSILERVLLVSEELYLPRDLTSVEAVRKRLLQLHPTSKQIRISQLMVNCLLNLTPLGKWYGIEDTLKEQQNGMAKRASDHFCAVHAILRISREFRHPFKVPVEHYFEERTKLGDYHPLNNLRTNFEGFFSMATSAKELNRLCAAFALPYQWEMALKSNAKRLFVATVCLLFDEIESVRMRACKALVTVDSGNAVLSPVETLKRSAELIIEQEICSQEDLRTEWHRVMGESREKLKNYNRYFEEFVVEDVLSC